MKFQKYSETNDSGRRSDFSDKLVSTNASQASKRDAAGVKDRDTLGASIRDIEMAIAARNTRKSQIELELASLNQSYRVGVSRQAGGILPQAAYNELCRKQNELKVEVVEIARTNNADKVRLLELRRDLQLLDVGPTKQEKSDSKLEITNRFLSDILAELKLINSKLEK